MSPRRFGRIQHRGWDGWHIAAAGAFSAEVDGTDRIVKEAFFRLSGATLDSFFVEYARRYGAHAANYARGRTAKWRSGEVTMSAAVSRRLYSLTPPFMSSAERQRIVAALWRRYAPSSTRYLYIGRDSSVDDVMAAVHTHFDLLLSLANLPLSLSARCDWLTGNDAVATRRMLMDFVEPHKDDAFTSARIKIVAMLAALSQKPPPNLDSLSHTVALGNHALILMADPVRSGLLISTSPSAQIKAQPHFNLVRFIATAAVIVGLFLWMRTGMLSGSYGSGSGGGSGSGSYGAHGGGGFGVGGAASSGSGGSRSGGNSALDDSSTGHSAGSPVVNASLDPVSARTGGGQGGSSATSTLRTGQLVDRSIAASGARDAPTYSHLFKGAKPSRVRTPPAALVPSPSRGTQTSQHVRLLATLTVDQSMGCSNHRIARVGDDGATINLDDGSFLSVSATGIMRYQAQRWQTGTPVVTCVAVDRSGAVAVSLSDAHGYSKIQATALGAKGATPVSCAPRILRSMNDDGRLLKTTDGRTYEVSTNGIMRYQAARWSTGDELVVCTAHMRDGVASAGLDNAAHSATVQASIVGTTPPSSVRCTTRTVVTVDGEGRNVELSDHVVYTISDAGIMRYQVAQWTTGETVRACSSRTASGIVSSIENAARYSKVQATRY